MKFAIGEEVMVLFPDIGDLYPGRVVNETATPFEYVVWIETNPYAKTGRLEGNMLKVKSEHLRQRAKESQQPTENFMLMQDRIKIAADEIYKDSHSWSTRPCPTCRKVSQLLMTDFGCIRKAKEHKTNQPKG